MKPTFSDPTDDQAPKPQGGDIRLTAHTSEAALTALIQPLCLARGLELVAVEKRRERSSLLVRVLIDRDRVDGIAVGSGASLADCEGLTKDLSVLFDTYEADLGAYRLEVSTPGLNRPLVQPKDFMRFVGQTVAITTHEAVEGRKNFQGELKGWLEASASQDASVNIEVDHKEWSLAYSNIKKAHIVYKF